MRADRIPLHPGTHLTEMGALVKLRDKWLHSSPTERLGIIQNIWHEIESFGDIYRMDLEGDDDGPGTD